MTHQKTVRDEFTRQAETFARSDTLRSADVTERIAAALPDLDGARVLDLACGPGILAEVLGRVAGSVVGLDLTAETLRLAAARSVSNTAFARADAAHLPFPENAFGAAVIRLALHHFEEPQEILSEVDRVLRPGSPLVVLDILCSADPGEASLHNAIERLRDPSHTSFLSADAMRRALERAGFADVTVETWSRDRRFDDWAAIVNEPKRTSALETVLRHLSRGGAATGTALREEDGELWFTYSWGLFRGLAARREG